MYFLSTKFSSQKLFRSLSDSVLGFGSFSIKRNVDQARFCVRCIVLVVQAFRFVWSVILATLRIHATLFRLERSYGAKGRNIYVARRAIS